MLIVDGALAVWNGLLVATAKVWCECVRGGTCCGGECHCDEGVCCGDVWHPGNNPDGPCQEGEVFLQWGANNECCGCVPAVIFDGRVQENVNTADVAGDLCCPVCLPGAVLLPFAAEDGAFTDCVGRCCSEQGCVNALPGDCADNWLPYCCEDRGCPKSCCSENGDGVVACDTADELTCAGIVDQEPCETACKGACCVDGELTENSPTTQAECESIGGCWWGVGSTECQGEESCRPPFDENCCESVTSSAARLTFRGPRKKRCPELDRCGNQVTVTLSTGSPVYVHGGLFGSPYETCTDVVTFFLCNDEFHVTPAPCSGNLQNLNIEVCWEEAESESELLRFQCCQNITYLLGNDDCECVTTLLYEGDGCTSNASIQMRGDAIIDASGAGALVLTTQVTAGDEERTLTLTGTSTAANTIGRISGQNTSVVKTGTGLWRLNAARSFNGTLTLKSGTLHVASSGAAGSEVAIGGTHGGPSGVAKFLLEQGQTASPDFDILASAVATGVYIGGANTAGASTYSSGEIRMGRDVTLVAADNGSVFFENSTWSGVSPGSPADRDVTIGAAGYGGVVVLNTFGTLATTGTVLVQYGTTVVGSDATLSAGTLRVAQGGVLQVGQGDVVGGGITGDVTNNASLVFNHSNELTYSGAISGTGTLTKSGTGTLTLSGALSYGGVTDITAGSIVTQTLVSGPAKVSSATFTPTSLTVAFSSTPVTGEEYKLLPGATVQAYGTVTLTGAGSATATYDSSTSTLTID